jgi:hypothetical protein
MSSIPKFADLPMLGDTGQRSAWGVFGDRDELGTVNFLTPDRVRRASALIRTGKVINPSLPLNFPITLYDGEARRGYEHHIEIDETIKHLGPMDVLVNKARDAWLGHTVTPQ